jgi:dTDP-4-amino-4,6-dideoxygalactose transaminase
MMPVAPFGQPNYWLSTLTIAPDSPVQPLDILLALEKRNIESRPVWKPMHLQPYYEQYPFYSHIDSCSNEMNIGRSSALGAGVGTGASIGTSAGASNAAYNTGKSSALGHRTPASGITSTISGTNTSISTSRARSQLLTLNPPVARVSHCESIAEDIFKRGICLPSDTKMTEDELNKVSGIVMELFR